MDQIKPRCLITGISGLLGNNLADYFKHEMEILGLYNRNQVRIDGVYTEKCDLTDRSSFKPIFDDFEANIIIHCASMTDIDECENKQVHARKINVDATKNIVDSIGDKAVKLIYISTDSVYDGLHGGFTELDKINPRNYYGISKYEGEIEVQKKESALIFRTNIFGWNILDKASLGEWVIQSLTAGETIRGFTDAVFSSIYTLEFAKVIDISLKIDLSGLFNCGSATSISKYDFSRKIAMIFGLDETLIVPSSIADFGFRAKRGTNLSLNVDKLQKAINYRLPTLDYCIESFYRDYRIGKAEAIKSPQANKQPSSFINYGRQWIDNNDIRAVVDVVKSGPITQGPKVKAFEESLAQTCEAQYAVALNSGTSGLHIACLAAGVKEGDEGITSPITFVASANCIVYCGGKPVFTDIDPATYNISPEEIGRKINSKTKVVIPVHFAGQSCDMARIYQIVKDAEKRFGHKIYIIEDASHALGSEYDGSKIGSCAYSDMAVTSFHPVKHITTGEGGAVFTNDESLLKRLRRLRSHGITSTFEEFVYPRNAIVPSGSEAQRSINPWYYEQIDLGFNYRITDIHSALGISQLKRLGQFKRRRREIVDRYNSAFSGIESIQTPFESGKCFSNFHLYVPLFDFQRIGLDRAQFISELKRCGIQTQVHYIPVHTQPYFQRKFGTRWGDCPNAEVYYSQCLSLPLYPAMKNTDIEKVTQKILNLTDRATQ